MSTREIIKDKRLEKGLTMKELGDRIGVSEATISRWESGEIANMKQSNIIALSKVLSLTPSEIMGWEEEPDQDPYYFDPEVAEMAEELKNNPEYRMLLDASRKMSKKDMKIILDLAKRMAAEDDTHHIE